MDSILSQNYHIFDTGYAVFRWWMTPDGQGLEPLQIHLQLCPVLTNLLHNYTQMHAWNYVTKQLPLHM